MYALDVSKPISCYRFGRMKQKKGWERPDYRSIEHNLFVLLIDGQADFTLQGRVEQMHTGDVLIIPANTSYKAYTPDSCEYFFLHFDGTITDSTFPALPPLPRRFSFDLPDKGEERIYFAACTSVGAEFRRIYNNIIACIEYHARGTYAGRRMLECEFLKILLTLCDIAERAQRSSLPKNLDSILVYIQKNLTRPITIEDICQHSQLSASYVGRLFKNHLGTTVTEYINSEKLYYACELINDTGMNLTEIAAYLGYCDVYYFSKRFKRKFGKSPSALKKKS